MKVNPNLKATAVVLVLFFVFFPAIIFGQSYTLTDKDVVVTNGVIQSCSASLTNKDVVIPSTLDGQTVTGIFEANWDGGVFRKKGIKSVVLPASMETIGAYAFADNSIESVNFAQLTKLKTIGARAFGNNKIKEVDLSKCTILALIDGEAFAQNTIASLKLTGCLSLVKILYNAFNSNQLASVDLSGCPRLEHIGINVFANNMLTSFNLPVFQQPNRELLFWANTTSTFANGESVSNLEAEYNAAFKPNYIPIAGELTVVDGKITAHKIDFTLHPDIIIPETYNGMAITVINKDVFANAAIKSVSLPSTLISLEYGAFNAANLIYLDLSKCSNLVTIGAYAFRLSKFSTIDLSHCGKLETIGNNAFDSSLLNSVDFSTCPNLKSIGSNAFVFGKISTLLFADNNNLEQINTNAFQFCKLTSLDLSKCKKLTSIGDGAFNYCKLTSLDINHCSSLIIIGKEAFANNSLTSFSLPTPGITGFQGWKDNANKIYEGGATTTNMSSFYRIAGKYTLTDDDVVMENGMIKSCSYSFTFSDITIPNQLDGQTVIGIVDNTSKGVFQGKGITGLVLPNTITYLGKFAFNGNSISNVNFNELVNLESICQFTFSTNALTQLDFTNCPKLKLIDNYAFNTNSLKSVVFPINGALSKIGDQAFRMNNLRSVDLSKCTNLREVHGYAFSYNSLSKFVLPFSTGTNRQFVGWTDGTTTYPGGSSVEIKELIIYKAVFYSSYTPVAGDLVVKNGVVVGHNINIEENPEIVIPSTYNGETITGIGYRVFYGSALESITLPSTLIGVENEAFNNCTKMGKIDISQCNNLERIGRYAFAGCKISSLDLSKCSKIQSIQDGAFVQNNIKSIDFTNCSALSIIGSHAFNGNQLTSVNLLPCTSLISLGQCAFLYCPMTGFKLPKSSINGEVVTKWVTTENQTVNSETTVTNIETEYKAVLASSMVYFEENAINFKATDRGKSTNNYIRLFNHGRETIFIKDIQLPDAFSATNDKTPIPPMTYYGQMIYFNPTENKGYEGEVKISFENNSTVLSAKLITTVNPNYDIKFLVKNETGPLANAKVTIDGKTTISTNQNGEAIFVYVAPNSSLNYSVEAQGYFQSKGTLNVNQHIIKPITLELISYPVNFAITSKGQAVEAAKVTLDGYGEMLTDEQGKVSFPKVVPQENLKFTVVKDGYIVETGSLSVSNEAVSKNIALTLITCNVSIVCFEKGSPVSGATVELVGYGQQLTNKEGIALFEKVEPTDSIGFTVLKKGYLSEEGLLALTGAKVEKRLELQRKSYNITLQCLSNGQVLEGVTVDLGAYGQQVSDVDGFVRFDQVMYSETQRYATNLYGYAPTTGAIAFVDGDSIQPIYIDFIGYQVEIAVVSGNTPVKDAVVIIDGYGSAQTNENGIAVFNAILKLDTIGFKISKEGFVSSEGSIVPAADKVTKAQVVLETLPVGIRFSCTSNGLPLAGVTVELEGYGTQVSDAKGVATFTNVAHTDKLNYQATLKGYDKLTETLTGITKDKDQVIQLELTTYTITLWCQDGSKALHGVSVELEGYGKQLTDENGKVTFEKVLPHDSIRYKLEAENYQAVSGSIAVVGSDVEQYLTMKKMEYTINFTTSYKGLPLAGVTVELEGYGTQVSNTEGVATFYNVAHTDKLSYQATLEGYDKLSGTLTEITKDINQPLQLNLIIYKISFLVSEATGPITGATVSLNNYGMCLTNEEGVAVFDSVVPVSSLEYEIQAEKYIAQTGKVTVTDNNVELKIELEKDKTGVKNQSAVQLSIYPNPANRVMTIEGAEGEWVTIYNNTGQVVLRHLSLSNAEPIEVGQIPNGSYLVKTSKYQAKLIVAHD